MDTSQQHEKDYYPAEEPYPPPDPINGIPDGCPFVPSTTTFTLPKVHEIGSTSVTNTKVILSALSTAPPIAFTADGNALCPDVTKVQLRIERIDTGSTTSNTTTENNVLMRQLYNETDFTYYLSLLKEFYAATTKFSYTYGKADPYGLNLFNLHYLSLSNLGIFAELEGNQIPQFQIEKTAFYLLMKMALIQPDSANSQAHFLINLMCCLFTSNPEFISQVTEAQLYKGLHVYTEFEYISDVLQSGGLEDSEALSVKFLRDRKISETFGRGLRNSTKEIISRKYGLQMLFTRAALHLERYNDALQLADKITSGNFDSLSTSMLNSTLARLLILGKCNKAANILKALNIQRLALIVVQGYSLSTRIHCEKLLKVIATETDGDQQDGTRSLSSQCKEKGIDVIALLSLMSGQLNAVSAHCTTLLDCLLASLHICPGTVYDSLQFAERLSRQCNLYNEFTYDISVLLMKHYAGLPCLTPKEKEFIESQEAKDRHSHMTHNMRATNIGPSGFALPSFNQNQVLQLTQMEDDEYQSDIFLKLQIGCHASYYNEVLLFIIVSALLGLGFGPRTFRQRQELLQPYSLAASYYLQRHGAYDYACIPLLSVPDSINGNMIREDISKETYLTLLSCIDKIVSSTITTSYARPAINTKRLASDYGISPAMLDDAIRKHVYWTGLKAKDHHPILNCVQLIDCVNYICTVLASARSEDTNKKLMKILLTNDDGYDSASIKALYEVLSSCGHNVTIVAPATDQSGKSQSLHYIDEIRITRKDQNYIVDGTPVDCVRLGLQLLPDTELLIAGINVGANCGSDVSHSGTIGACFEAAYMGCHAISYSLDTRGMSEDCSCSFKVGPDAFQHCGEHLRTTLNMYLAYIRASPHSQRYARIGYVWSVNIPPPHISCRGYRAAILGHRYYSVKYVSNTKGIDASSSWTMRGVLDHDTPPNRGISDDVQADFDLVKEGYVTITPLNPDRYYIEAQDYVAQLVASMSLQAPSQLPHSPVFKGAIVCTNDPSYSIPQDSDLSFKLVDDRLMDTEFIILYEHRAPISGKFPQPIEFLCPPLTWNFDASISVRITHKGSLICINDEHVPIPLKELQSGHFFTIPVIKIK